MLRKKIVTFITDVMLSEYSQSYVDELYDFRDHYVEWFGLDKAGDKEAAVQKQMEECLEKTENLQGGIYDHSGLDI